MAILLALGCACNVAPSSNQKSSPPAAAILAVGSTEVSFGNVTVGASKTGSITLTNSSTGAANATVTQIKVTGGVFTLSPPPALPIIVASGASVKLGIVFKPKAAGSAAGSLSIDSDASTPTIDVSLSGNGMSGSGQSTPTTLALTPSTLSFGNVTVGASKSATATLMATGSAITISTVDRTGEGYSVNGISFPVTIAAGKSVSFTVTFEPSQSGSFPGELSFLSTANTASATLSGAGAQAQTQQHSVSLSWNPVATSVLGYNVYRGTKTGGPYSRINSSPLFVTDYTDAAVQSGAIYFYVATSLDIEKVESAYSNETKAVIPSP